MSQRETEAVVQYREALRHDPEFGRAYSGLAASLLRLGRRDEAQKNWDEALRRTDRMTEREKLRTFGVYYLGITRNYDKAIETYEELVTKFPSDSAGYNNLAVAHFILLNFAKALEYGRKAIQIYPKTYRYRGNYALYAMYAGDFATAATTAQALIKEDPRIDGAYLPLAMEALSSGDAARARRTFEQAAGAGEVGASLSALGLPTSRCSKAVTRTRSRRCLLRCCATRRRETRSGRQPSSSRSPRPTPLDRRRGREMRQSPGSASFPIRTAHWCR